MEESGVIDKTALVFGQMDEPPGVRLRVALSALTMAEYFRDVEQQDEKNLEMGKQVVTAISNLTLSPLVLMLVWNACIPGIFGLATIGYWSAMGLYVVSRILLKKND